MSSNLVEVFVATCPFIWLSILYYIDYKYGHTEKSFFLKPMGKALSEMEIIRELCFSKLSGKSCPIFRNILLCTGKRDDKNNCIYEPWFKPEDILDPVGLAKRMINAAPKNNLDYFLGHSIPSQQLQELKPLVNPGNTNIKKLSKRLSDILNQVIRDRFIYSETRFKNVDSLDKDLKEIAALKINNGERFKHLQLNSYLLEKAYPTHLDSRIYLNRFWKVLRNNHLCRLQANFFEFITLEFLIIFLNKYRINLVTDTIIYEWVLLLSAFVIMWYITLSQGEPFDAFIDKRNRFFLTAAIWGAALIEIIS